MEMLGIISVVIVIFIVFAAFRPVDPESKTDTQLRMLYNLSSKRSSKRGDHERIEAEMRKRGLIGGNASTAEARLSEPHLVQLAATKLRHSARMAYDVGWKMAEEKGGLGEKERHNCALRAVLLMQLQEKLGAPPTISEELINMLDLEAIPFRDMETDMGKDAIAEYVLWRKHPKLANIDVIQNAVDTLKASGFYEEVLKDLDQELLEFFPPWVKLF